MEGIYAAWNPSVPLAYGLNGGDPFTIHERKLAIVIQIDLTSLKFHDESTIGPPYVVIQESVPLSAIKRILIFDPHADPLNFPWTDLPLNP